MMMDYETQGHIWPKFHLECRPLRQHLKRSNLLDENPDVLMHFMLVLSLVASAAALKLPAYRSNHLGTEGASHLGSEGASRRHVIAASFAAISTAQRANADSSPGTKVGSERPGNNYYFPCGVRYSNPGLPARSRAPLPLLAPTRKAGRSHPSCDSLSACESVCIPPYDRAQPM